MKFHRETLKLLAVLTMTVNHTAIVLLPAGTPLYMLLTCVGYFTAPVMCRLLADGCRYTSDLKRYKLRLLLFALLSQLPYMAALQIRQPNILFSLFICLCIADIMDRMPESLQRTMILLILVVICSFCDWSCILPLFMIWLKKCDREQDAWIRMICLTGVLNLAAFSSKPCSLPIGPAAGYALLSMVPPAAAALCMLHLYDGKPFFAPGNSVSGNSLSGNEKAGAFLRRTSKWFFYIYYPAHLAMLALLRLGRLK